jgi:ABC-type glycerol-3-phosphate transport system substrate-binding protein
MILVDDLAPSPEQTGGSPMVELFQTGKIATMSDGVWRMLQGKDWDFEWQIYYHPAKVRATGINWNSYNAISSQTKYPGACWEWLKYWTSPEWQYKYNQTFGYIAPRKSVNSMKPFVRPELPHVDWNVYITAAEKGHRPPAAPRNSEVVWTILNNAWEEVLTGQKTVEEAFTDAAPESTELLQMGYGLEEAR